MMIKNVNWNTARLLSLLSLILLATIVAVSAQNAPGSVDVLNSTRRSQTTDTGVAVAAQAGNVTALQINDTRTTNYWQGYYGDVKGEITLDDATNQTLYDWQITNPTGEVFASNFSSVSWANITCVNMSANITDSGTRSKLNGSILESTFNITGSDIDGINETFNATYASSFSVGTTTIDSTYNCPLAYMYVNSGAQATSFQEVVLTDNVSVIFTALVEDAITGFDGAPHDFEMIVPENQAGGTTDFYFFVELT